MKKIPVEIPGEPALVRMKACVGARDWLLDLRQNGSTAAEAWKSCRFAPWMVFALMHYQIWRTQDVRAFLVHLTLNHRKLSPLLLGEPNLTDSEREFLRVASTRFRPGDCAKWQLMRPAETRRGSLAQLGVLAVGSLPDLSNYTVHLWHRLNDSSRPHVDMEDVEVKIAKQLRAYLPNPFLKEKK